MIPPLIILPGHRFVNLVVIMEVERTVFPSGAKVRSFLCRCDCGKEKVMLLGQMTQGRQTHCGCLHFERLAKANRKPAPGFGDRNRRDSRCYNSWSGAVSRCYNPKNPRYDRYGGRGIKMCVLWRNDFAAFFVDMGEPPTAMTIDRINNDGHYSCGHCKECKDNGWPLNCRWASEKQQSINRETTRMATINGETKPILEWCVHFKMNKYTVKRRIEKGMSSIDALTTPVMAIYSSISRAQQNNTAAQFQSANYPSLSSPDAPKNTS